MNSNDHNAYEFDGIIHETPEKEHMLFFPGISGRNSEKAA